MGRKVQDGKSVRVTVPQNTTLNQGDFALLDGFLGMVVTAVTTGTGETKETVLNIEEAVYETGQIDTAQTFAKGAAVYWDAANKRFTDQAAPDASGNPQNRPAGRVVSAKDANNIIWLRLGPQNYAHGG